MSNERDKAMVRQSVTETLSFLRTDRYLAERIVSGQLQKEKAQKSRLRRAAALCAAAALVCVILWNWPAPTDLLAKGNTAVQLPGSTEEAAFSPREWREWCPKCDEVTLWLECCLADMGAREIRPVGAIEEALAWRERDPECVLIGERHGRKLEGFDFGNSPSTVSPEAIRGRRIIHTTSAGTQGATGAWATRCGRRIA